MLRAVMEETLIGKPALKAAPATSSARRLGDYELIDEIARGGMGIVYRARQISLERVVAVKTILRGNQASAEDLERFLSEAIAAGKLDHPNILPIYEIRRDAGVPYFSMRLAAGGNLEERLARGLPAPPDAARLLAKIARAVHHAHNHGILHRDLKPANILLDHDGEPFVSDFGLAKRLAVSLGATEPGSIIGTPGYMAPEQASGDSQHVTIAADIYSLGVILYEVLTGRLPFTGASAMEMLRRVVEEDVTPPRTLDRRIPTDIEAICLKCLEKDPLRRYASAEALAEDLERFVSGETVLAEQSNPIHRLARLIERNSPVVEFRNWSRVLVVSGTLILLGHAATFLLIQTRQPEWTLSLSRGLQLLGETILIFFWRPQSNRPRTALERQLWSLWLGFLLAHLSGILAGHGLLLHGAIERAVAIPAYWTELASYPCFAVLVGLAFFAMGSSYWGKCYVFGVAFFVLAPLMPLKPEWSPLEFGGLSSAVQAYICVHLRQMAK
ncbi:MAG TPA: serine/threonine-protein kinase [Planctomycetota bacterium]|nr:serine/threonine-protein kinase [Planctomycetota bacterium]